VPRSKGSFIICRPASSPPRPSRIQVTIGAELLKYCIETQGLISFDVVSGLGLAGVTTRPAGYTSSGVPPAVERRLHLHHTPSRVPHCREAAPLTPHAQPSTPAVGSHQLSRGGSTYTTRQPSTPLSRGSSTYTTRSAGYPSGGVPPAVERQLYILTYNTFWTPRDARGDLHGAHVRRFSAGPHRHQPRTRHARGGSGRQLS
jgi:hypothetical protein